MATITKSKIGHEIRMAWGGCFPHPVEDIDIFNRLPSWRQTEVRESEELLRNNPHARLFLIYDPSTREPYPGQVPLADIEKKLKEQRKSLPTVPSGYKFVVPDGVPRGVFYYSYAPEPTEEQAKRILRALEQHVTHERLIETCTYDQRLFSDKPLDGVIAFIWRLARYMSGCDMTLPATAFVDLIDGVSQLTHLRVNPSQVKPIVQFFESKAEELVDVVGGNRHAGALRWAQATGVTK